MFTFIKLTIFVIYGVTAQACFKDKISSVTIQNYEGPIYVSPCQKSDDHCSLYHLSGNPCESGCTCVSKNPPVIPPVLCGQTPCGISTPQVPCGQSIYEIGTPQLPCAQTACGISTPQLPCGQSTCLPMGSLPCSCNAFTGSLQGCVSLQGTYLQSSTPWAYCQSCPDIYREGWPQYNVNDYSSLPVAKCANQFGQCGMIRSGYY